MYVQLQKKKYKCACVWIYDEEISNIQLKLPRVLFTGPLTREKRVFKCYRTSCSLKTGPVKSL